VRACVRAYIQIWGCVSKPPPLKTVDYACSHYTSILATFYRESWTASTSNNCIYLHKTRGSKSVKSPKLL